MAKSFKELGENLKNAKAAGKEPILPGGAPKKNMIPVKSAQTRFKEITDKVISDRTAAAKKGTK